MPAFTFVLKEDGGSWSAKRLADEEGESLTAEASDSKSLQTELLNLAQTQGASGSLAQSYSPISPSSGVYQVVIGGPAAAGAGGGGAAPAAGGAAAPAAEEAKEEAKEEEEEEDEDMGFSLFD